MRILYVTSKQTPWFESQDAAEHFREAPYSIDAIGYNLEKLGWAVGWMGLKSAKSLFSVARRIDECHDLRAAVTTVPTASS